jgi:hypothetical protein
MKKPKKHKQSNLTVRFPEDLLEKIRQIAKRDERSINSEIIYLLKKAIGEYKSA